MKPVAPRRRFVILPDQEQDDEDDQDSNDPHQGSVSPPAARPSFLVEQRRNHDSSWGARYPIPPTFGAVPSFGLISNSPFTSLSCKSSSNPSRSPKSSRTFFCAAGDSFGETFWPPNRPYATPENLTFLPSARIYPFSRFATSPPLTKSTTT